MPNETLIKIWRELCAEEARLQKEHDSLAKKLSVLAGQLQSVQSAKHELERELPASFRQLPSTPATHANELSSNGWNKFKRLNGFFEKSVKIVEE